METHSQCLICDSHDLVQLREYFEKHGLVQCKACGFVFMNRVPTATELNEYYAAYSYASQGYLSLLTIKSYQVLLDEFEKYRKHNRILDVGCGRGWFLMEAKKRGWDVYGTEFSETAVRICEESGIRMSSGQLNAERFPLGDFDVITSFEVLEHINNPHVELQNIQALLRTGGLLYCTTPNFNSILRYYLKSDYNVITYPEHLSYYTKRTLSKLMRMHGLRRVKFRITGVSITRIRTSKKISNEAIISKESADEKLREQIDSRAYLRVIKGIVNMILTWSGLGMTLKGYYVKR